MNKWVSIAISAVSDAVITAGTAYMAIGGTMMPTRYQISVFIVGGIVAAARGVQKLLSPPPA